MKTIDTDEADLMILDTVIDTVETFMKNALGKEFMGGDIPPEFQMEKLQKPQNWLSSPVIVGQNELELRSTMERQNVGTTREAHCFLSRGGTDSWRRRYR